MIKFDCGTVEKLFDLKGDFVDYLIRTIKLKMERDDVPLHKIRNVELIKTSYANGDCEFRLYINTNDKQLSFTTPNLRNIEYKAKK